MTVSELVVKLLFQSDKVKVDEFVKSIKELNIQSLVSLSAFGTMAVEMKNLMVWASQSALVMAKFGTETGLSADEMGTWANVAKVAGISAQDAFQGVVALQKNLALVRMGMASPAPFAQMGINPSDDPFKVIKAFSEWAKNHRPVEAALMAERIGLPRSMLNMIKLTQAEWIETEKLFKIDQNMIRQNEALRKEYEKMVLQLQQMGMSIATFAAPHVRSLIDLLRELFSLISQHSGFFILLAAGLMVVFAPVQMILISIIALMEDLFNYLRTGKSYLEPFYKMLGNGMGPMAFGGSMVGAKMPGSSAAQNHNTFHFTIPGAGDPESVAEKIKKKLEEVFSDVIYQDRKDNY